MKTERESGTSAHTWRTPESSSATDTESKSTPSTQPLYTSKKEVIENLERMSASCISAFNDRDFAYAGHQDRDQIGDFAYAGHQDRIDLVSAVSPKYGCYVENYPNKPLSWPEPVQLWQDFLVYEPDCHLKIPDISTDIFANGTAVVYVEVAAHGVQNIMTARFMEMKWKFEDGKWIDYSCTTMEGSVFNSGLAV